jgi:hypothetical protein
MASGWTNSGIDWTSSATMRNSRTEDIIKELYLAVSERDHYINKVKFININNTLDPNWRDRMESLTKYIQETVSGWLLPILDIGDRLNGGVTAQNMGSICAFLDTTDNPVGVDPYYDISRSYFYSFKNLDYTQGGNFETQYGIDLSLLRVPPKRISLEWCSMIYQILQEDLHTSTERWIMQFFQGTYRYFADGTNLVADIDTAPQYRFIIQDDNKASGQIFNDIVTDLNNNDELELTITTPPKELMSYQGGSTNLSIETIRSMLAYKIQGESQTFELSDLNTKSIVLGFYRDDRDNLSLLPFSNIQLGLIKDSFFTDTLTQSRIDDATIVHAGVKAGTYHVFEDIKTTFDNFVIGSATGGSTQTVSGSYFVAINKEGFLNYYTEP